MKFTVRTILEHYTVCVLKFPFWVLANIITFRCMTVFVPFMARHESLLHVCPASRSIDVRANTGVKAWCEKAFGFTFNSCIGFIYCLFMMEIWLQYALWIYSVALVYNLLWVIRLMFSFATALLFLMIILCIHIDPYTRVRWFLWLIWLDSNRLIFKILSDVH